MSPLSGESYDDTRSGSGRLRYDGSDGYGAKLAESDPYERDYDEVVTTLWLPMRDLGVGDVGTDVGMLQQAFGLPASGVFDKSTAREIARWQQDLGLPKTGYFGVASREAFARAAADARNAERERMGARRARGAPGRGQPYVGTNAASTYGPQDRPSLDALAPVTTARSGRETYGSAVRVPTDRAPPNATVGRPLSVSGSGVSVGAVAFVAAAAAAAGAAASRRARRGARPRDGRSSIGATMERIFGTNDVGTKETPLLSRRASLVTREGHAKTRASPYDDDGRGFGAPTVPRRAVRADPSPRGKRGGSEPRAGGSPTSGSLPAKPFYVATSPAPAPAPGARSTDWNARESWSGKPPPYDELVGFPKQKGLGSDPKDRETAFETGGTVPDANVAPFPTSGPENDTSRVSANEDRSSFAANLPRRANPSADAIPPRGSSGTNDAATRETRETRVSGKRASANVGKKESRVTSEETKNEETKKSGLGGVLAKAFGFDRRKNMPAVSAAETRETSLPVSAEAGETNDERDERPESNGEKDVRRSGREGDAPEPARGGLTASDQMARLAALKEEEEARLARLNRDAPESRESKTAREAPRTSSPEASRNETGSEKEALRRERERLMRAQSARLAKRSATAKEQTKSVNKSVSSSENAKTSEDEAFEARVRAAKGETFEETKNAYGETRTSATDAPDPSTDPRPPVGGWDEKPSAAAPPASARAESPSAQSSTEFEIPKMPEKSFDEMSFEERVATAVAQSRNSGVADRVQKALIGDEAEEEISGEALTEDAAPKDDAEAVSAAEASPETAHPDARASASSSSSSASWSSPRSHASSSRASA